MYPTLTSVGQVPARTTVPALLLRLEGLALFIGALVAFAYLGQSWWLFGLLLLSPDLGILGYLHSPRLGSLTYNLVHTESLPLLLGLFSLWLSLSLGMGLALIWLAHIGMDRVLGYGLKYSDSFTHTHLGEV